jgi:uncharacterized protein (DUF2252 family)
MARPAFVTPDQRQSALDHLRNQKMAASAHAFVRGSTAQFYTWLEASDRPAVPDGPALWICGDCHVGNLGPIGSARGKIAIEIRDFDQTVIGNPAHDLIRLGLSLAMAARGSDLPGVTTARMIERMIIGYEAAFAADARGDGGDPISDVPKAVDALLREAAGRSWRHLARERIEDVSPTIPRGKRFWPLTPGEREAVDALFATEAVRRLATSLRSRADDAPIRVLDAAYWRKGCSSLGKLRLAVLVAVGEGKAERHCLMDVKEAGPTVAPRAAGIALPQDEAMRVVTGARLLSPYLGERMLAAAMLGKPVFLRELLPQDLKLEVERLAPGEAVEMAQYLAHVVGRAHSRQLPEADADNWVATLQRGRSKSLDAPSWLWNSVVDLAGVHEAAYLQHCRRYALAAA